MDSSIDINELAKKITKEISEHSESKNEIKDEDFQKLIELEKLNKKLKKKSLEEKVEKNEETKTSKKNFFYNSLINLKIILIESLILIILFVLINHEQFNKIINFIPIECLKNNNIINLLFKGSVLSLIFRLLSIIVN